MVLPLTLRSGCHAIVVRRAIMRIIVNRNTSANASASSVNTEEISRFDMLAADWWNDEGSLRVLHAMNEVRVPWVRDTLVGRRHTLTEEVVKQNHSPLKGLSLLDVGCGGGLLSEPLARLGANVTGVDASREAIAVARRRLKLEPDLASRIEYVDGAVESLPTTTLFDAVVASEIIEHVDDPSSFVTQLAQRTRSGGSLFFTTINRTPLARLLAIQMAEDVLGLVPKGVHDYDKFVSPTALSRMLVESDCVVRLLHGLCYNPLTSRWRWIARTDVNYGLFAIKL